MGLKEPTRAVLPAQSSLDKQLPESVFQVRRNQTLAECPEPSGRQPSSSCIASREGTSSPPWASTTEQWPPGERRRGCDLLASSPPPNPSREREIQTKAHSHRQSFQEKPSSRDAGSGVNKEKMQNSERQGPKNISPAECAMKRKGTRR